MVLRRDRIEIDNSRLTIRGIKSALQAFFILCLLIVSARSAGAQTAYNFVPVTPCRIADTRNATGPFGGPAPAGGSTRSFTVPNSACGIPPTAAAYSLNVTVVPQQTLGYLSIWPTGEQQPLVSTLNSTDGRIKANAAIVPAGTGGAVSVYVTDTANVILDINGYFVPTTTAGGLAFYPVTPCRVADTRNASGSLGGPSLVGSQTRSFPVLSACSIPSSAQAYSLNFTAIPQGPLGYLSVWPAGQTQPLVSTLNALTGTITANAAIVPAGTGGAINLYASNSADVVIDINGYFAPPGPGGLSFYSLTPCRVLDTRQGGVQAFSGTLNVNVTGFGCGVPTTAQAYGFNATVVPSGSLDYLTLWPQGETQPFVSTLNAVDGALTSNMAIVPTNNGSISAYATSSTQLIFDISGYFAFTTNPNLFGSLGVPQPNTTVSGSVMVQGWAFENTTAVSKVDVLVDSSLIGQALYGFARPDVALVYPNAPTNIGYAFNLPTAPFANGQHTVTISVTNTSNNVAVLPSVAVLVDNPPPPQTGPVATVSLAATKTLLTVGDIIQLVSAAADPSGNPLAPQFAWTSSNAAVAKVTPTGAVLALAPGTNVTVSAAAGGKSGSITLNVGAGSGVPGTIQISLGPTGTEEKVFNYSTDACWPGDGPDNQAHALRLADGSLMLDDANAPLWFMNFGSSFYSLQRSCDPVLTSVQDPTASSFTNLEWISSVYLTGGVINALIHNEFHDPVAPNCLPGNDSDANPCWYNSITYASSTDGGRTFGMLPSPLQVVAPPPVQWNPTWPQGPPPVEGYFNPSNIVLAPDGFYYSLFVAIDQTPSQGRCVMRTQTLSDPTSWRAWNGSSFSLQMTDPYTGPPAAMCAYVGQNQLFGIYGSLTYNNYLNKFMFLGTSNTGSSNSPTQCGIYFSLSSDFINWTSQQFIGPAYFPPSCLVPGAGGLAGSIAYPSIIDHDDPSVNFESPERTPYLYFTRWNDNGPNRDLIRVPLIITQY